MFTPMNTRALAKAGVAIVASTATNTKASANSMDASQARNDHEGKRNELPKDRSRFFRLHPLIETNDRNMKLVKQPVKEFGLDRLQFRKCMLKIPMLGPPFVSEH